MGTLPLVEKDGVSITCFWYNPNIHPFTEYRSRKNALIDYIGYIGESGAELIEIDEYGLVEFTKNAINDLGGRCVYCYETRIKKTAKYAKENNFDAFSTTLLVSPYQDHEKIKQICEKYAEEYKTGFFYRDFRENFKNGQKKAREKNIYMQKYCGCIFSEGERYQKIKK